MCGDILELAKNRNRGHSKKLFKKRANKDVRKNFFTIRIHDMWNDLPQKVIDSPSIKCFEARLDKYWDKQDIKLDFKTIWKKMRKTDLDFDDKDEEELDLRR